jgi:hypothetical protein
MSVIRAMSVFVGLEALKRVFFHAAVEAAKDAVGKENAGPLLDALLVEEADKRLDGFKVMMDEIIEEIASEESNPDFEVHRERVEKFAAEIGAAAGARWLASQKGMVEA